MDSTAGILVTYSHVIVGLGGASSVFYKGRSARVRLTDREIRLPTKEIRLAIDDGVKVAEIAKAYAYKHA